MMMTTLMTYAFLQHYWWVLISLLGALLVFLMFVQGANALIFAVGKEDGQRRMMINSTGRKWELAFTTLVTFGGAFFASFPLFYSTSFGGAYWVWILLLITFVFQAVSYEFQNKKGNLLGSRAFQIFLMLNGILAPLIVGAAVGTFFTGSDFIVNKDVMMLDGGGVISTWGSAWHGLEALSEPLCLALGGTVLFADLILGCLYMLSNIRDLELEANIRKCLKIFSPVFLVLLVLALVLLFTMDGYAVDAEGQVCLEAGKYLHNLLGMPVVLVMFLLGALLFVAGILMALFKNSRKGIWPSGLGIVLFVMSLFFLAAFGGTAYYPSSTDLQSSLTLQNSSSSEFTLTAMFYISFAIPFVLAYIFYAWRQMDKKPLTREEIDSEENKY